VRDGSAGAALLAVVIAAGCLPEVEPPWLVDETTIVTVTTRVVALGPLAPERGSFAWPTPMVEALPGDVLELEAVVMDEHGELVAAESAPVWLMCGWDSGQCPPGSSGRRPAPCPIAPTIPVDETCVLGEGALVRFGVGPLNDFPYGPVTLAQVIVAAGTPGVSTGASCLERLQSGEASVEQPLWDCRFTEERVELGPGYPLALAAVEAGFELDPPPSELPEELRSFEPDRAPVIESFTIARPERGDELRYGDVPIDLRAGEMVEVIVNVDPTSVQSYFGLGEVDGMLVADEYVEQIYATWFSAEPLEDVAPTEGWLPYRRFRMPESGRVRHVVVIEDGRGARTWKTVDLEVAH
jgi:hypothetical protein